jgi:dipeptide/tripeptide permease
MLMSIYVKENFGILEDRYGFIVAINALMVIFLQYFVTRITVRYRPLPMLALGALFYAAGALSISLGRGFEAFALSMVIITTGELIVSPTGLALAARLAPPDMRARYMSVYSLTWSVAQGIAPVIGGQLNDRIAPVAMWYGAMVYGLAASAGFYVIGRAGWGTAKPAQDELAPAVAK